MSFASTVIVCLSCFTVMLMHRCIFIFIVSKLTECGVFLTLGTEFVSCLQCGSHYIFLKKTKDGTADADVCGKKCIEFCNGQRTPM